MSEGSKLVMIANSILVDPPHLGQARHTGRHTQPTQTSTQRAARATQLATRCNLYYIDLYYIVTMIRNQRSTANSVEEFRSLGSCGEMSHGEGVAVA